MSDDLYSDKEKRLDTVLGDAVFWPMIAKMKMNDFGLDLVSKTDFRNHVLENYGIEIYWDPSSENLLIHHDVRDEEKFLFFMLKYR